MRTLRPSPSAFALSSLVWLLPFTLGLAALGASAVSDDDSEEIEELEAAQWQDDLPPVSLTPRKEWIMEPLEGVNNGRDASQV